MTTTTEQIKRFLLICDATSVSGHQVYYVDARTEEEAIAIYKKEGGELYSEELEVQDLSEPAVLETTTLDDYGNFPPAALAASPAPQLEAAQPAPVPVAWTLQWPGSKSLNFQTTFSTDANAKSYANLCADNVKVVPLYAAPAQQEQAPQPMTDADPNAPWLSLAHVICSDAGIAQGHIEARLETLRDKLELSRHPAQPVSQDIASLKEQNAELVKDAERLDWLAVHGATVRQALNGHKNLIVWGAAWPKNGATLPDNFRAAIDAAIASAHQENNQ